MNKICYFLSHNIFIDNFDEKEIEKHIEKLIYNGYDAFLFCDDFLATFVSIS